MTTTDWADVGAEGRSDHCGGTWEPVARHDGWFERVDGGGDKVR